MSRFADAVLSTEQTEFSDLLDPEQLHAWGIAHERGAFAGAAIGRDRERRDACARLRTHMLVALGAALFVLLPAEAGLSEEGRNRVVTGIGSAIGFLGAGCTPAYRSAWGRIRPWQGQAGRPVAMVVQPAERAV